MMHSMVAAAVWSVVVLVIWVLVVGAAVWAALRIVRRPRQRPGDLPSPLEILERRVAAGEMTREDFVEARARLREHEVDV